MNKIASAKVAFVLAVMFFGISASARIWYLKPNGTGDATSWENAGSLETLPEFASIFDEYWLAKGVHDGARATQGMLQLIENVGCYGGFDGTETQRDQRDWKRNPTILSGSHYWYQVQMGPGTTLDGFHVVDFVGYRSPILIEVGGGNDNPWGSPVRIANCEFRNNAPDSDTPGGVIQSYGGRIEIENCLFESNQAGHKGGAIYALSLLSLKNCVFRNNRALGILDMTARPGDPYDPGDPFAEGYGGAIFLNSQFIGAVSEMENCLFENNFAKSSGGAIYNNVERVIYLDKGAYNPFDPYYREREINITHCAFKNNIAETGSGGAMHNDLDAHATISNSILWGNRACIGHSVRNKDATSRVIFSCVQYGLPGEGNISNDPLWLSGSVRLRSESPCLDSASPQFTTPADMFGTPRGGDAKPDMGPGEGGVQPGDIVTLSVTATPEDHGSVEPPTGTYQYARGDHVRIRAIGRDGWGLSAWQEDGSGHDEVLDIEMDRSKTVVALFAPRIIHVDADSSATTPDGLSWATAYRDIQSAIDAPENRSGCEIWVAEGLYVSPPAPPGHTYSYAFCGNVSMRENIHLYGGFAGDETQREERDWRVHLTSITSRNYARCSVRLASNAELDGFKVSSATYVRPIAAYYAHTTVRNCTFAEAKSSIDLLDSQVTFRDCTFVMDSDWEYAGVFICRGSLNIENCIISVSGIGTTSTLGGIYSDIRLKNTTILHTQTPQTGYGWGPILGLTKGFMNIDNSIVWCPLSPEKIPLLSPSYVCGTVSITGSCISGGYEGVGNISDDPGFVNPPLDLRLKEDSPCINTGLNGLATDRDMLGVPRPQGLRVDMGAYEAPQNNAFLMVNVEPEDAVAAGAQWRRVGESRWRNPGELADGFPLGAIQVEFKPLDEWRIPDTQTVVMNRDDTSEITAIYKAQCLCITRSPVGTFAGRGTTISLSVQTAHGIGTLTYQWKHNGGTIPGATSREWTTPPLTLEDSGDYVCEVSDNERTVASSAATIEVVAEGLPLGPACSFASLVLICLATIFRFKLEKRAERSTVRPKNTN